MFHMTAVIVLGLGRALGIPGVRRLLTWLTLHVPSLNPVMARFDLKSLLVLPGLLTVLPVVGKPNLGANQWTMPYFSVDTNRFMR